MMSVLYASQKNEWPTELNHLVDETIDALFFCRSGEQNIRKVQKFE